MIQQLALGNDDAVARWLGEKLGVVFHPPYVTMRIEDETGRMHAAYLFNNYNQHSIEVSIYGAACVKRRFIRAVCSYAFDQLGVMHLRGRSRRGNKPMVHLFPRLGFTYEATLKNYFGPKKSDDALMFRASRSDAEKWKI